MKEQFKVIFDWSERKWFDGRRWHEEPKPFKSKKALDNWFKKNPYALEPVFNPIISYVLTDENGTLIQHSFFKY